MTTSITKTKAAALVCAAWLGTLSLASAQAQPAVTGAQALRELYDKRDVMRKVEVTAAPKLKIGKDAFDFTVRSGKQGFVYVLIAGADNKTLQLLFPNRIDSNNRIAPGHDLKLPRPNWPLQSAGPAGTNTLLVMVADGPRDLSALAGEGPFITVPNDATGRAKLGEQMTRSSAAGNAMCKADAPSKGSPLCSGAYGAAMATVEEVQ